MVTKEQAMEADQVRIYFHRGDCKKIVGPRGGVKYKIEEWRSNGKCKTWKTRRFDFKLPIKYGFNGPYDYIMLDNCDEFHLSSECPLFAGDTIPEE